MRTRRLLSATVGIISALVVGLPMAIWVGFPTLAPLLLAPLLEARGVQLIRLDSARPALRGLTVNTLELAEASMGLGLRGEDIRITWEHPLRALDDGLASVIIGRLAIALEAAPAAPGAAARVPSALTLPATLLAALPTRELEITELTASGRIAEQTFEGQGRLRASPREAHFSGILRATALPAPMAIRAEVDAEEQVSLRVDTDTGVDAEESGAPFLAVDGALSAGPAGPAFAGTAHLDLEGLRNWLDAPDPWPRGILDLHLSAALEPTPTLTLAPTSTGRMGFRHEDVDAVVVLALTAPLAMTFTDGRLSFTTGTLPLRIEARRGASALQGDVEWAAVEIDAEGATVARLTGAGRASWPDGRGGFDIDLPLRAEFSPLRLQLAAGAELTLRDLQHQQAGLERLRVRSTAPSRSSSAGLLEDAELALLVDDPARLELTASLRMSPAGDIDARIEEASLPLAGNDLLAMVLPAALAPRSGRVSVQGRLARSASGVLDAALQTRWQHAGFDTPAARVRGASGTAAFSYAVEDHGRLDIDSATASIDHLEWISPEGPHATILLEKLSGSGNGSLGLTVGSGFELDDIAMNVELAARRMVRGELAAQHIDIAAGLRGDARLPNIEGRLRLDSAAVGVPVRALRCGFETGNLELWQLRDCAAEVLGGEVRLPQGEFDLATGDGYLPLALTGLQLSAVLGLMQDPALDGTGTLDGSLPLRLKALQPTVEQGWLAVRPPGGMLAYVTPTDVLAGIEQPALRLTLRAVRDLRYQRLESRVDYTEDGVLTLAVDLLGSNPELEGGRPIQLHLNVTQNLLTLLQSLRLSDNIEQQLHRRMQRVQP